MYRIYRKVPDSFQGDFEFKFAKKKWYILEDFLPILRLKSWSLPDDEGGITCMMGKWLFQNFIKKSNCCT